MLNGAQKIKVDEKATESNKLHATGVKIAAGAKIVVMLNDVEGKTATVRFTIK